MLFVQEIGCDLDEYVYALQVPVQATDVSKQVQAAPLTCDAVTSTDNVKHEVATQVTAVTAVGPPAPVIPPEPSGPPPAPMLPPVITITQPTINIMLPTEPAQGILHQLLPPSTATQTDKPRADGSVQTDKPRADSSAQTDKPCANSSAQTDKPRADSTAQTEEQPSGQQPDSKSVAPSVQSQQQHPSVLCFEGGECTSDVEVPARTAGVLYEPERPVTPLTATCMPEQVQQHRGEPEVQCTTVFPNRLMTHRLRRTHVDRLAQTPM